MWKLIRFPVLLGILIVLSVCDAMAACPAPSFFAPPVYGPRPSIVKAANIDGDGNTDLVVGISARTGGGGVAVLLGNSNGSFRSSAPVVPNVTTNSMATADFNEDRLDDVAVYDLISQSVLILVNRSGQLSVAGTYHSTSAAASELVAGDFNGDGHTDLVLVQFPSSLLVLAGRGDGTFEPRTITLASKNFLRGRAAVADLNGDGRDDLALTED